MYISPFFNPCRAGKKKVRVAGYIDTLLHGLVTDKKVLFSQAGLLTCGSPSDCTFPLGKLSSGYKQSLSPLTALAQRYGFAPYSLFTSGIKKIRRHLADIYKLRKR